MAIFVVLKYLCDFFFFLLEILLTFGQDDDIILVDAKQTTKEKTMSNIERAINHVNALVANGWSLKEAIVETAWEFGIGESELWWEFPEK